MNSVDINITPNSSYFAFTQSMQSEAMQAEPSFALLSPPVRHSGEVDAIDLGFQQPDRNVEQHCELEHAQLKSLEPHHMPQQSSDLASDVSASFWAQECDNMFNMDFQIDFKFDVEGKLRTIESSAPKPEHQSDLSSPIATLEMEQSFPDCVGSSSSALISGAVMSEANELDHSDKAHIAWSASTADHRRHVHYENDLILEAKRRAHPHSTLTSIHSYRVSLPPSIFEQAHEVLFNARSRLPHRDIFSDGRVYGDRKFIAKQLVRRYQRKHGLMDLFEANDLVEEVAGGFKELARSLPQNPMNFREESKEVLNRLVKSWLKSHGATDESDINKFVKKVGAEYYRLAVPKHRNTIETLGL